MILMIVFVIVVMMIEEKKLFWKILVLILVLNCVRNYFLIRMLKIFLGGNFGIFFCSEFNICFVYWFLILLCEFLDSFGSI